MDEKTEHIQVTLSRKKYNNSEYDDNTVECLMKYLELESYDQLEDFLKNCHIPNFDWICYSKYQSLIYHEM